MAELNEQVEAYRGRKLDGMLDTIQELLRSAQALGPRRLQSAWHWTEPEVEENGPGGLRLLWKKPERTLLLSFRPDTPESIARFFLTEAGRAGSGGDIGIGEAGQEIVQFLSDNKD